MRTKNSFINIIVSFLSYGIIMVSSFVTKSVFVRTLGLEIVGIESGFLNVVSMLAIVELGLGVGIVYKLYRPIAEKNWEQVAVILCFLRKCYYVIAVAIMVLGAVSSYFVAMPIKEDFSKLWLMQIFMLYVMDVVASYFYSHKRAMFIADQKNYVNNSIHIVIQIILFASQITILKIFGSFEAYLICRIILRLAENMIISYRFDKKYSYINLKTDKRMPEIEKKDLFKNMKALLCHKISGFGATTVSSLIIIYFISLRENGIYGNYMLVVMGLNTITNELFNGILASFGNLLNTESREKVYRNFNILYFINFLMYSFIVSGFLCMSAPFVTLLAGEGATLGTITTISIAGYLYIYGIRQSITMAKVVAGIYDPDKYMAILGAFVTFLVSLILAKPLGIIGVMIGNIVGIMSISYWVQAYLVYDEVFKKDVKPYHTKFILYTLLTSLYAALSYSACGFFKNKTSVLEVLSKFVSNVGVPAPASFHVSEIVLYLIVCMIIPNTLNLILFYKTDEFKEIAKVMKSLMKKFAR